MANENTNETANGNANANEQERSGFKKLLGFFSEIPAWFKTLQKGVQAFVIIGLLSVVIYAFYHYIYSSVGGRSDKMLEPYILTDDIIKAGMSESPRPQFFPLEKHNEIKNQFEILQGRKLHHLNVALYFVKNNYATALTLMLLSSVGALVLFVLLSRGWGPAGLELKSVFFAIVLATLFFGLFPKVFKQDENYKKNLVRYLDYSKAQINMVMQLSELSRMQSKVQDSIEVNGKMKLIYALDSAGYLNSIDTVIKRNYTIVNELNDFILSIDVSEVKSMNDMYRSLESMINAVKPDSTRRNK